MKVSKEAELVADQENANEFAAEEESFFLVEASTDADFQDVETLYVSSSLESYDDDEYALISLGSTWCGHNMEKEPSSINWLNISQMDAAGNVSEPRLIENTLGCNQVGIVSTGAWVFLAWLPILARRKRLFYG